MVGCGVAKKSRGGGEVDHERIDHLVREHKGYERCSISDRIFVPRRILVYPKDPNVLNKIT